MSAQIDPLTQALDIFEAARQDKVERSLRDIVAQVVASDPSARGQRPRLLRELIKIDLEHRCYESEISNDPEIDRTGQDHSPSDPQKVGEIPLLEAYLNESPDVSFGDDSLLELIEHEYCVRYHSHEPLALDAYSERFPHLGDAAVTRLRNLQEDLAVESSIRSLWNQPDSLTDDSDPTFWKEAEVANLASSSEFDESIIMDALRHVRPFSELTQTGRQAIADKIVLKPFHAGDVLLRQGDVAESLLIVLDGVAEVTVEDEGSVHSIARLGRNTVVGEIGLFTQELRSANVVAIRAGCAGIIARDDFEHIAGRYPRLSIAVSELIADRVGTLAIDCLCGKSVDRYLVQHRLGRGAMGIVYAAVDDRDGTPVALKMLRHDLNFDRMATLRFHQEAEIVRGLEHPNIVRVFDEFPAFGTAFICMELCDGISLSDLTRKAGALPMDVVRAITGQIACGLLQAHQSGIAHRDLKPANVMLTNDGLAKLADFGLARSLTEDVGLTQFGQIVGTPRYMAPEQLGGERGDARADLFALGSIAYELLTGRQLFQSRKFGQLIEERLKWVMPSREDIPAELDQELYALLEGCLRETADQREVDLEQVSRWATTIDWSGLCPGNECHSTNGDSPGTVGGSATRLS